MIISKFYLLFFLDYFTETEILLLPRNITFLHTFSLCMPPKNWFLMPKKITLLFAKMVCKGCYVKGWLVCWSFIETRTHSTESKVSLLSLSLSLSVLVSFHVYAHKCMFARFQTPPPSFRQFLSEWILNGGMVVIECVLHTDTT